MINKVSDKSKRFRAALIVDNNHLTRWQAEAILDCVDVLDVTLVLNCRNTKANRRYGEHFLYYVISLCCLKNKMTKMVEFNADDAIESISFDSHYEGRWQHLPDPLIEEINKREIDVIIKFGMNLLIVPDKLKVSILSYHHGDPSKYRGRPAGFYEFIDNAPAVGIIVQRLSNKLDGGDICAQAYSKLWHISYRKTAVNFYRNSISLLRRAILNLQNQEVTPNPCTGRNYTLPSNWQSLWFICLLAKRKISWFLYGALFEKKWNIMLCRDPNLSPLNASVSKLVLNGSAVPKIDERYVFYADPFFSADGSRLYTEALNKTTGLGEIIVLNQSGCALQEVVLKGGHFSYPQAVAFDGTEYLLPEISNFSSPCFVKLKANAEPEYHPVLGLESCRVVDATYLEHDGAHYIFASFSATSKDNLQLFVAQSRFGPYVSHPMNPVVVDPACARMAGELVYRDGKLFRFGQNNSYGYGDSIALCEIQELSPTRYKEKKVKEISFEGNASGPHTLNFHGDTFVTDFFKVEFSPLAGYRRFLNLLPKLAHKIRATA